MARIHARKRGKSGSTKPELKIKPDWSKYKPEIIEKLIEKLAKEGKQPSLIGLVLRDVYGIPDVKVILKKSIKQVMAEKGMAPKIPDDLRNLIKRALNVRKHLDDNKHDLHSRRGLGLIESKIKRLVRYYKRRGVLPGNWVYSPEKTKLLIE